MNETYDLSWNLKRRKTAVLFNRTLNFPSSLTPPPDRTYTLPVSYADVDYITFEVEATCTTSTSNEYSSLPHVYGTNVEFTSKSIEIPGEDPGSAKETRLSYASNNYPDSYSAVNPWASGTLPLDSSLPWKEVTYSASSKSMSGSFKATINNPFKNNTKDTYLHGSLTLYAGIVGSSTDDTSDSIRFYIDDNILTLHAYRYLYSYSLKIKITAQYTVDM